MGIGRARGLWRARACLCAYESCCLCPREVHPPAVSGHFYIHLGLGIYMVAVRVFTLFREAKTN